jgi:hypothetical protein
MTTDTIILLARILTGVGGTLWLCACAGREPMSKIRRVENAESLQRLIGAHVIIRGVAKNAKINAMLVRDDFVVDLGGVKEWPPALLDHTVDLKGTLEMEDVPAVDSDPGDLMTAAPAPGISWVIRNPSWSDVE